MLNIEENIQIAHSQRSAAYGCTNDFCDSENTTMVQMREKAMQWKQQSNRTITGFSSARSKGDLISLEGMLLLFSH